MRLTVIDKINQTVDFLETEDVAHLKFISHPIAIDSEKHWRYKIVISFGRREFSYSHEIPDGSIQEPPTQIDWMDWIMGDKRNEFLDSNIRFKELKGLAQAIIYGDGLGGPRSLTFVIGDDDVE